jgi:hypothetical protein
MNKNELSNEVYFQTEELGTLFLSDILSFYIYPRIFICKDNKDIKYLFYEVISTANVDTWLVCRISKDIYTNILEGKTSIQSIYIKASKDNLFFISISYGQKDITMVGTDVDKLLHLLPTHDIYYEKGK